MRRAFLMEAIDGELTAETLPQCDVVLVCLYPQGIIDYVTTHAADFKPDSLVIDCGGVKQVICDALFPVSQRYAWHFIGGHPMAGREYSGFKYARDDLFRPCVDEFRAVTATTTRRFCSAPATFS